MALQPHMFPEIEGPDFIRSEDIERVAQTVLSRHGKAGGIPRLWEVAKAIRDEEVRVLWLLNTKPFDPDKEEVTHDVAGKCVKAPGLWHDVTGFDVAIWIREYFWTEAGSPQLREAMLLHELLHVEVKRDKDDQASVAVRKHDIEDFVDVARHYGTVVGDGAAYVRAAALFGAPEPTPLRSVADVSRAALDAVADAVDRGELDDPEHGVTVTVTRPDKTTRAAGSGKLRTGGEMVVENERCPFPECIRWADHAGQHDLGDGPVEA